MIADPKCKPDNGDSDKRRRQEERSTKPSRTPFRRPIRFQSRSRRRADASVVPDLSLGSLIRMKASVSESPSEVARKSDT